MAGYVYVLDEMRIPWQANVPIMKWGTKGLNKATIMFQEVFRLFYAAFFSVFLICFLSWGKGEVKGEGIQGLGRGFFFFF